LLPLDALVELLVLLVLLLLSPLLPHAASPNARAKHAESARTVLLANRCNVTPPQWVPGRASRGSKANISWTRDWMQQI
jgi:hypothetical protein